MNSQTVLTLKPKASQNIGNYQLPFSIKPQNSNDDMAKKRNYIQSSKSSMDISNIESTATKNLTIRNTDLDK